MPRVAGCRRTLEHARIFIDCLDLQTASCALVTTRIQKLVPGAVEVPLGVLPPDDAVRLLPSIRWPSPAQCCAPKPTEGLHFLHFPIVDCSTANDTGVLELAHDLVNRLASGENLYVHCW